MEYRILDYSIKNKGRISDVLAVIFGMGLQRREYVMFLFGFGKNAKAFAVNYYIKDCLRIFLTNFTYILGLRLRSIIKQKIEFFVSLWTYKGLRFRNALPMRGQSTKSNARTIKYTVSFFNLKKY